MKVKYSLYLLFLITSILILISCNDRSLNNEKIEKEILQRIEILDNSFKFSILPENKDKNSYKLLKENTLKLLESKSENSSKKEIYKSIKHLFAKYNIAIIEKPKNRNEVLFNVLVGLDKVIFKYLHPQLSFSEYKAIVIPNKTCLKTEDTLSAEISLGVSDSLYEPEFVGYFNDHPYNLPTSNGVGQYNIVLKSKGQKEIKGHIIYSNERGGKDTINWKYKYEVK